MSLKDQLKSKSGSAAPKPAPVDVKVDNDAAAAMVDQMQAVFVELMTDLRNATQMNAALLKQLTERLDAHEQTIAKLAAKEPAAPTVVMPERPGSFEVDIQDDEDGKPRKMRIVANKNLH